MPKKIDDDNLWWLGFDSHAGRLLTGSGSQEELRNGVPWSTTVSLISRPQMPFRAIQLRVHRPVASSFLIHAVRVSNRDKAYELKIDKNGGEMLRMPLSLPTAEADTDITLLVENIGQNRAPLRFVARMLGVGHKHECSL